MFSPLGGAMITSQIFNMQIVIVHSITHAAIGEGLLKIKIAWCLCTNFESASGLFFNIQKHVIGDSVNELSLSW